MDARLVDDHIAGILARLTWIRFIRFSCDQIPQIEAIERAAELLGNHGKKPYRYTTPIERKLLSQVIYSVTGRAAYGRVGEYTGRKRKQVGIECTAAERLEIQFDYDFFREALEEEMDRFFSAFLIKNGIFPPEGKEQDELPPPREISREEAMKLESLMMGMDRHTRRAALESGVEP